MDTLIDYFTPGELLHIVSIANQHGFLKTEHKRFLIALRMTSPWEDGTWQVEQEKKDRFIPILGQFFQELEPWQRCGKEVCPHCDRFQALHTDFHGSQESPEFKLFMDWFLRGSRTYVSAGTSTRADAKAAHKAVAPTREEQVRDNRQAFMDSMDEVSAVMQEGKAQAASLARDIDQDEAKTPLSAPACPVIHREEVREAVKVVPVEPLAVASVEPAATPVQAAAPAPVSPTIPVAPAAKSPAVQPGKDISRTWDQPLFTLNPRHPAILTLQSLASQDLHLMDDYQLREFTQRFQKLAREFIQGLGGIAEEDASGDGPDDQIRRIG